MIKTISLLINRLKNDPIATFRYYQARFKLRHVIHNNYDDYFNYELQNNFIIQRTLFKLKHGYPLNLESPKSFSEKLVHRRIFSREKIWPRVTNKISARTWIEEKNLDKHAALIPIVKILREPGDLKVDELEFPCIIKGAWASGYNIFLKDRNFDVKAVSERLRVWADTPYEVKRLIWAPHQMNREFIVEKMLLNKSGESPEDFKFYVFQGKVELIQIHLSRFNNHSHVYFDRNLKRLNISRVKPAAQEYQLPKQIAELILAAERIGEHFAFARIDLYLHDTKVYFGEITQTPGNGFVPFHPKDFDFQLGEKWNYRPEPYRPASSTTGGQRMYS